MTNLHPTASTTLTGVMRPVMFGVCVFVCMCVNACVVCVRVRVCVFVCARAPLCVRMRVCVRVCVCSCVSLASSQTGGCKIDNSHMRVYVCMLQCVPNMYSSL